MKTKTIITVRAKIHSLTKFKSIVLEREYYKFQQICQEISDTIDWDFLPDKSYKMFKTSDRYSSYGNVSENFIEVK